MMEATKEKQAGTAVVPFADGHQSLALIPTNLDDALRYAKEIAESDFVPKDYQKKPGNVLVAMQMGLEVGLKPLMALQNIAVINGRPTIWGDIALALVRGSGKLAAFRELPPSEALKQGKGSCTAQRVGEEPITYEFTVDDAKKAGLMGGNRDIWNKYPGRMLQMRARSWALRDTFADVLKGLAIREEVQDYDVEKDLGNGTSIVKPKRASEAVPEPTAKRGPGRPPKAKTEAQKPTKTERVWPGEEGPAGVQVGPEGQLPADEPGDAQNYVYVTKVSKSGVNAGQYFIYIDDTKYWTNDLELARSAQAFLEGNTPVTPSINAEGQITLLEAAQ